MNKLTLPKTAPGEIWALIKNPIFSRRYYISSFGRLYDTKKQRIKKTFALNITGYRSRTGREVTPHYYQSTTLQTNIRSSLKYKPKSVLIHRLMAETFLGKSPKGKPEVNHLKGSLNNRIVFDASGKNIVKSTIEWISRRDNTRVLTTKQVDTILMRLYEAKLSQQNIANDLGIEVHLVNNLKQYPIWLDRKAAFNKKVGKQVF